MIRILVMCLISVAYSSCLRTEKNRISSFQLEIIEAGKELDLGRDSAAQILRLSCEYLDEAYPYRKGFWWEWEWPEMRSVSFYRATKENPLQWEKIPDEDFALLVSDSLGIVKQFVSHKLPRPTDRQLSSELIHFEQGYLASEYEIETVLSFLEVQCGIDFSKGDAATFINTLENIKLASLQEDYFFCGTPDFFVTAYNRGYFVHNDYYRWRRVYFVLDEELGDSELVFGEIIVNEDTFNLVAQPPLEKSVP